MTAAFPEFPHIERVLIDEARIAARVGELGRQIAMDLRGSLATGGRDGEGGTAGQLVLVPVLTGSIVFVADLIRRIPLMMNLRVVAVSSYPGASLVSKGAKIRGELPSDLAGRHVLIVDDILDTGRTLGLVRSMIAEQEPASLRVCVLLRKAVGRDQDWSPEYVGFDIPDEFVVGYGLDFDGYYRNFPAIAALSARATGS
jgi:hypoxanthine phosphoribosyltransferase